MSYANPRPAKLKLDVETKTITGNGNPTMGTRKAGTKCKAQRNPGDIGWYILYFGARSATKQEFAKIPAEKLRDYIDYTDGLPDGHNF